MDDIRTAILTDELDALADLPVPDDLPGRRSCAPTRSTCSTGIATPRQGPAQEPAPAGGADARARPGRGDRRGDGQRDQLQHRLDVDLRAGVDVRLPQALRQHRPRSPAKHDQPYHVVGSDLSGVVLRVGPGVTKWKAGDEVVAHCLSVELEDPQGHDDTMMDPQQRIWGFETNFGGLAELALVKSNQLMPKPAHLTWEEAAAPGLVNSTAYRQLVSHHGANDEAGRHRADLGRVRRPRRLRDPVRAQRRRDPGLRRLLAREGRDLPRDGRRADHRPHAPRATSSGRTASSSRPSGSGSARRSASSPAATTSTSSSSTRAARRSAPSVYVTTRGGTIVTCASTSGYMHEYDNRYLWMTLKRIVGSHFANYRESWEANRLIAKGAIHPTLSQVYSLAETGQAAYDVHRNLHQGKVGVLCLAPEEGLGVRDTAAAGQAPRRDQPLPRGLKSDELTVGQRPGLQWDNRVMVDRRADTSSNTDVLPMLTDANPGFDSAMRGYDRAQVDSYLSRLDADLRVRQRRARRRGRPQRRSRRAAGQLPGPDRVAAPPAARGHRGRHHRQRRLARQPRCCAPRRPRRRMLRSNAARRGRADPQRRCRRRRAHPRRRAGRGRAHHRGGHACARRRPTSCSAPGWPRSTSTAPRSRRETRPRQRAEEAALTEAEESATGSTREADAERDAARRRVAADAQADRTASLRRTAEATRTARRAAHAERPAVEARRRGAGGAADADRARPSADAQARLGADRLDATHRRRRPASATQPPRSRGRNGRSRAARACADPRGRTREPCTASLAATATDAAGAGLDQPAPASEPRSTAASATATRRCATPRVWSRAQRRLARRPERDAARAQL